MAFSLMLSAFGFAYQLLHQQDELSALRAKNELLIKSPERLSGHKGTIEMPTPGATVPRTFSSSGTVTGFREGQGVHIWLAVEVGGLMWPKEGALDVNNGQWSMRVSEDGTASEVSLSLFAADEAAHDKIMAWLNGGEGTGKTGMNRVEGTRRLDRIDVLRLAPR